MILQSKDKFDELAHVNQDTGRVTFLSKSANAAVLDSSAVGGYSIVDGVMWSLYRVDGKLNLCVGEQRFEITDDVRSRLVRTPRTHTFQLLRRDNILSEFTYSAPSSDIPLQEDPTPFAEEEDFDFPLFVHNVLGHTGRRQRVYDQV